MIIAFVEIEFLAACPRLLHFSKKALNWHKNMYSNQSSKKSYGRSLLSRMKHFVTKILNYKKFIHKIFV